MKAKNKKSNNDNDNDNDNENLIEYEYRLLEFNISEISYDDFTIQMFALNKDGENACIRVTEYKPHFYIKVPADWNEESEKYKSFTIFITTKIKKNIKFDFVKKKIYMVLMEIKN